MCLSRPKKTLSYRSGDGESYALSIIHVMCDCWSPQSTGLCRYKISGCGQSPATDEPGETDVSYISLVITTVNKYSSKARAVHEELCLRLDSGRGT